MPLSQGTSQLFVKEGNDFVYQKGTSNPDDGYKTSVYRHCDSEMRVVICRIPRPVCTLHIYVPTIANNNKGLPHTLEHLIFCGSKRHPDRGYLDALAVCNFSQGTNAWTAVDHTCYTLSASSEQAVANLLPVYLDHVLNPLLRDQQFVTEVYHYDENGKEQGVVFSEMSSRENDEYDLASGHINNMMYPAKNPYTFETGGRTPDIATLTNQEIIDYHREYYDTNNITVVMTGAFGDDFEETVLQKISAEILESNGCNSRTPIDCSAPPKDGPRFETVHFPSSDADVGSVWFAWRGPMPGDSETKLALKILLDYLAENPSSPLNQRFVERSSPLANSISFSVDNGVPLTINVQFFGVPYASTQDADSAASVSESGSDGAESDDADSDSESNGAEEDKDAPHLFEERYYENLLLEEIKRVYDSGFDGDAEALLKATKRMRQTMAVDMENQPEEIIQDTLCADIVANHFLPASKGTFTIGTCSRTFDTLDRLAKKPVDYWLDLVKTWLLDQKPYHVVMVPDEKMGERLEAKRKEIELANVARIADKEAHAKAIAQAIDSNKVNLSDEVKSTISVPDASLIVTLPHTQTLITLDKPIGPVSVVQSIECDSEFPYLSLHIPIDTLSDSLRAYLVLFQELLFSSDLELPAGLVYSTDEQPLSENKYVGYVTVDSCLADITTSKSASVGADNDVFSCSQMDEVFLMSMRMYDSNYDICARWFTQILMFSQFTSERILSVAQNLLSTISGIKRDEFSLSNAIMLHYDSKQKPNGPRWGNGHISIFEQEAFLKNIAQQAKSGKVEDIVGSLNRIRDALIRGNKAFLAVSTPIGKSSQTYIEEYSRQWNACYEKYSADRSSETNGKSIDVLSESTGKYPAFGSNGVFPIEFATRMPDLESPVQVHFPLASVLSSCVQMRMKNHICCVPTGKQSFEEELQNLPALEYHALYILTELISRMDGPLFSAIRGKGFAYGAYVYLNMWSGQLIFLCYRASDVPRAILSMRKLIEDLGDNWDKYVDDFEINAARSTIVNLNTSKTCTPFNIVDHCILSNVYGYESAKQLNRWRNTHLAAVGKKELRQVYDKYFKLLADPSHPMATVIISPPETELLPEIGEYERKTLESIREQYKVADMS
ncbi:hypothetical protein LPJ57_005333 [Coemansia sp. RSA 486]|nr:hypothetical protein LPJ57_005333 [Coemansia sp. RSA 486]